MVFWIKIKLQYYTILCQYNIYQELSFCISISFLAPMEVCLSTFCILANFFLSAEYNTDFKIGAFKISCNILYQFCIIVNCVSYQKKNLFFLGHAVNTRHLSRSIFNEHFVKSKGNLPYYFQYCSHTTTLNWWALCKSCC